MSIKMWRPWGSDETEENIEHTDGKRNHLSNDAKQIIKNVYNSLCVNENENSALRKTADLTKVPYSTVCKIIKSKIEVRKHRCDTGKSRILTEFQKDVIRRSIYDMYKKKTLPTTRSLHQYLTHETDIKCSFTTLYRTIIGMGFKYKEVNKRQVIMESRRLCEWRYKYIINIKQYRAENRPIIYLDETWYDSHDIVTKSWQDNTAASSLDVPVSRGKRIIILHAGYENGWINDALLLSAKNVKDSSLDYHDNMSADIFEPWFENKLIPNLPPRSVIVMDNASYHSRQSVKVPSASSKKSDIVDYLYEQDLYFEASYTKVQLLEVVKTKPILKKYVCDAIAENFGHTVLRLPPYYCVFNPIELIWGQMKANIRRNNSSPTNCPSVISLIKNEVNNICAEKWSKCIRHVVDIEDTYVNVNNIVKEFIIHVSDSSSDSDLNVCSD